MQCLCFPWYLLEMAGMNFTTNNSVTVLRESLPNLNIINPFVPNQRVTIGQSVDIGNNVSSESESRILWTGPPTVPTVHIKGSAIFVGDRLRLHVALETEGQGQVQTPAKIIWKVAIVSPNRYYQVIGEKTNFIKLPPQHMTTQSDDYLELKLRDINPRCIQNGLVQLEWEASLEWFHAGPIATPLEDLVLSSHQICDILERLSGRN